ncbi:hypothetical protein ISF_05844 [Cordyceps fumosorosea ARSEF 2679]|uniref:Tat pathway signal sequence n=1 Tax=Cordyceps fumosorosea (strain ARSEF 2679) TaxID=1081104 RepID=A0A167TP86_CORFA|nr:hypothetical protein ISF_05844 [Cordyceps fumosorosea ARSEF 2679]OAA60805.1 hypothetical protein ISF_05844 [Cordyceps fumosorosea ARSEF 2679]
MKFSRAKILEKMPAPLATLSYTRLADKDAASEEQESLVQRSQDNSSKPARIFLMLNILLLFTSLGCLAVSVLLVSAEQPIDGTRLLREKTFYSPPLDTLTPDWTVSNTVTEPLNSDGAVFRQDPSPRVDAAWGKFADMGVIGLTAAQVAALGKDPALTVKAPPDWGLGNETYLAQLDAVHLAHCLNSMRRSLHFNFAHYHPRGVHAVYATHLAHCQEALARWLACQPSMELLTFNWVEGHKGPFPDFEVTRKCWDYDRLLEWQDEHRVQTIGTAAWAAMSAPEGAKRRPSSILHEESLSRTPFGVKGPA